MAVFFMRQNRRKNPVFFWKNVCIALNEQNNSEKNFCRCKINNKSLYDDIVKKADDFEAKFNKVTGIKCH